MPHPAADPQSGPPPLWTAGPNMLLLWGIAALAVAVAAIPLHELANPVDCSGPCPNNRLDWLFGVIMIGIGLISLPLALLIPIGGFDLRYRLDRDAFTIRRRILGREWQRRLAMPGHVFGLGRGNQIYIHRTEPGTGLQGILPCLRRLDRDALRDALPEGAWR